MVTSHLFSLYEFVQPRRTSTTNPADSYELTDIQTTLTATTTQRKQKIKNKTKNTSHKKEEKKKKKVQLIASIPYPNDSQDR